MVRNHDSLAATMPQRTAWRRGAAKWHLPFRISPQCDGASRVRHGCPSCLSTILDKRTQEMSGALRTHASHAE